MLVMTMSISQLFAYSTCSGPRVLAVVYAFVGWIALDLLITWLRKKNEILTWVLLGRGIFTSRMLRPRRLSDTSCGEI